MSTRIECLAVASLWLAGCSAIPPSTLDSEASSPRATRAGLVPGREALRGVMVVAHSLDRGAQTTRVSLSLYNSSRERVEREYRLVYFSGAEELRSERSIAWKRLALAPADTATIDEVFPSPSVSSVAIEWRE
jgi:uncharacterized protein YcfL